MSSVIGLPRGWTVVANPSLARRTINGHRHHPGCYGAVDGAQPGRWLQSSYTTSRDVTEIVAKLRQVDVLVSQGKSVAEAVRAIGVTEVTYYRWRQEFGGLKSDQVKRMKELEAENARLRRAVSDLTLDKMILAEAARGNF
jgi:cell division protein FtsB